MAQPLALAELAETYRQQRAELGFLDANLWLGRPRQPEFARGYDLAALQQLMARYDLQGGVVSHFAGLGYSPATANEALLRAERGPDLWAAVTLLPERFDEEPAGRAYLAAAIVRGARLARVFPGTHHFSVRSWCSGALFQALADSHMPVAVWRTELSWEDLRYLCATYPELTVILESGPQKIIYHSRVYYPLLAQHQNLRLELHSLVSYLGVEDLAARFGARSMIFGSYLPVYDPNAAMMQVTHARLSLEEKRLIARGNLSELLAGVRQL
jgi:hypothetical protein